ncbi:amine sulfotransferase-like [Branchiostoma floridae]|uniref:Sulfotransferase n=1 Tax=Branchiostoma floridae TaxID=7739 RepID=A0A9J7M0F9_BRAFL|nr:amine sulfotransferase-like [Branchiostoma floridae]
MALSQQHPLPESPPYMECQGMFFPYNVNMECLEAMKTFEIRDDDVVIVKAIVVLRNPKDICVSSYHFSQKTVHLKTPDSWEQYLKDFFDGNKLYGDYFDHVLGWWQMRNDPHFLFVKYEDMKKDFRSSVKMIAAFLEKELTDENLASVLNSCSLESMRKTFSEFDIRRKVFVRNGAVGDWKNHFSAEESARFDQKYRERMAGTGLEFDFE